MPTYKTSDRLKQIMAERNLKQIDIVNLVAPYCKRYRVKLGRNDMSQYVSGKVEPRQNKLYILSEALNVSEAWLMGYDVPMERTELINQPKTIIESDNEPLASEPSEIEALYNRLDLEDKCRAKGYIENMLESDKYQNGEKATHTIA